MISVVDGDAELIRYALVGARVYFGFLLVAHLISPRGMGFGDVKLAAVMGLYVGWLGTTDPSARSRWCCGRCSSASPGSVSSPVSAVALRPRAQPASSRSGRSSPSARVAAPVAASADALVTG